MTWHKDLLCKTHNLPMRVDRNMNAWCDECVMDYCKKNHLEPGRDPLQTSLNHMADRLGMR